MISLIPIFAASLFIQAGAYQGHDLLLARAQRIVTFAKIADFLARAPTCVGTIERDLNGIQQILFPQRFRKELDGSSLHRFHAHRYVAMARDENNWDVDVCSGQLSLEIKSAQARQTYVQNQATRSIRKLCGQEFRGRSENLAFQSDGLNEAFHALADVEVVVDNIIRLRRESAAYGLKRVGLSS